MRYISREIGFKFFTQILLLILSAASVLAYTVTYNYDTGGQLANAFYSNKANVAYGYDSRYNLTSANVDTFPSIGFTALIGI
jgi:hypothetical protein